MSGPGSRVPAWGYCRLRGGVGLIEALQRARHGHASAIRNRLRPPPSKTTNGGNSALLGQRRQRIRRCHARGNALSGIGCGRERHARPGRCRHDDRARNCHGLSPALGGYADVGETERGMISGEGSRHSENQCDGCTDEGRAERRRGDLRGNKGDAAGDRADDDRRNRPRTAVIRGEPCGDTVELCGVLRYVAREQRAFLWSTQASFLRHIFWRG
jgi:hypothetical protein